MPAGQLRLELVNRVDGGINLAGQDFLGRLQRGDHLCKCGVAHDHHINVALRTLADLGKRTIDKSHANAPLDRTKRRAQDLGDAAGLDHQTFHLSEYRAFGIRLIVDLVAADAAGENSGASKPVHLAVDRAEARPHSARQLPKIESLVGMREQQPEYGAARAPEQS